MSVLERLGSEIVPSLVEYHQNKLDTSLEHFSHIQQRWTKELQLLSFTIDEISDLTVFLDVTSKFLPSRMTHIYGSCSLNRIMIIPNMKRIPLIDEAMKLMVFKNTDMQLEGKVFVLKFFTQHDIRKLSLGIEKYQIFLVLHFTFLYA